MSSPAPPVLESGTAPPNRPERAAAPSHPREPWIAMSLSMLCVGLGQLYCGRARRGLIMNSAALFLGLVIVAAAAAAHQLAVLFLFLAALAALCGLCLWSVIDARRLARSLADVDYVLQDYNHASVYLMMALPTVPYALGLALFLRSNVIEAFVLPTSSMAPTLLPGDRVLTNKLGIGTRALAHGDVIVFRNPQDRRQRFIKRVVGLPGETIEVRGGAVWINGAPLPQEPASDVEVDADAAAAGQQAFYEQQGDRRYAVLSKAPDAAGDLPPQTVPPGSYFVLGDNRGLSLDSRKFGPISQGEIVGVVTFLYKPARSWARFGQVR